MDIELNDLPVSTQNYLKAAWLLKEWSPEPVTKTALAARVGVTLSSASDAVRKLTQQGLFTDTRYGALDLTEEGSELAVQMVRRHRLLEAYLQEKLGYTWDEVHAEAEVLEHAVSDLLVARIDDALGRPTRDPHGDPIPTAEGVVDQPSAVQLSQLPVGAAARVERISDADDELLRFLAAHGVRAGVKVRTQAGAAYTETVEVVTQEGSVHLGAAAADAIWVAPAS